MFSFIFCFLFLRNKNTKNTLKICFQKEIYFKIYLKLYFLSLFLFYLK